MSLSCIDLGNISYADAYALQLEHHARVLSWREQSTSNTSSSLDLGTLLLLEHDPPVITVSRRAEAPKHLLASDEQLAKHNIQRVETDRGGDITYHGPGQLVVYAIIDLNRAGLRLHEYMRALEAGVIAALARFDIEAHRDANATGVWVGPRSFGNGVLLQDAKICAMGVRVRQWVSMHGLALNVTTNLEHFQLIVPCGLAGRSVTSLQQLLGTRCPSMLDVKRVVAEELLRALSKPSAGQQIGKPEQAS